MATLQNVVSEIKKRDKFLIMGHIDPDGDCIGSVTALKMLLDQMGKKSELILHDFSVSNYLFLFSFFGLKTEESNYSSSSSTGHLFSGCQGCSLFSEIEIEDYADQEYTIIALDSASLDRLGEKGAQLAGDFFVINMDHHPDNPGYGDLNYVAPRAAAVGEIIYDLAEVLEVDLSPGPGTALAVALISDTGSLRYKNTSARILRILADLMDKGVDLYKINSSLYGQQKFTAVKLKGLALSALNRCCQDRVAWVCVDRDMLSRAGAETADASELVNSARDIKGVKVGLSFVETEDNKTKVSLRSVSEDIPVNKIAFTFGGGGHPMAAGCTVEQDIDQVVKQVLAEVKKFV